MTETFKLCRSVRIHKLCDCGGKFINLSDVHNVYYCEKCDSKRKLDKVYPIHIILKDKVLNKEDESDLELINEALSYLGE